MYKGHHAYKISYKIMKMHVGIVTYGNTEEITRLIEDEIVKN